MIFNFIIEVNSLSLVFSLSQGHVDFLADRFYADSYGSGLLLRGVLLHFLRHYEDALQCFNEILHMFVFVVCLITSAYQIVSGRNNSKQSLS